MHKFFYATLFTLVISSATAITKRVYLTPPRLEKDSIAHQEYCDRPKRNKGCKIAIEHINNKTIIHCYGHGGYGFTTLFGSIELAANLLFLENIDPNTPIRIIGSGCMGLTLAIELSRAGFNNIAISTKELYNLPSWRAGGYFDPGTGDETSPLERKIARLGLASFSTYQMIEQGNHPYLTSNIVQRIPVYAKLDITTGVEILEKHKNLMPQRTLVTLDFGNGVIHENYVEFFTYFIDIPLLMQQLWEEIHRRNISVTEETIVSFNDCHEQVICNCAGLEASKLADDTTLYPARGHFFMLNESAGDKHMNYMIFTKIQQGDSLKYLTFFPKRSFVSAENHQGTSCRGMIGSTFVAHIDELSKEEQQQLNEKEWHDLWKRAVLFFYGDKAI